MILTSSYYVYDTLKYTLYAYNDIRKTILRPIPDISCLTTSQMSERSHQLPYQNFFSIIHNPCNPAGLCN